MPSAYNDKSYVGSSSMDLFKEQKRLAAVQRYLNFNSERQNDLKDIVMLASVICNTPIALITLMDADMQVIKARVGFNAEKMPRHTSFCTHAIEIDGVTIVTDASQDERFASAPAVVNDPNIRFYASANLRSNDGFNVGTLCVYDTKPKELTEQQVQCLSALANQVSNIMELDRSLNEVKKQNSVLREVARIESHELRQPVASIMGLVRLIKDDSLTTKGECLDLLDLAVNQLDDRIRMVVQHVNNHPESYVD